MEHNENFGQGNEILGESKQTRSLLVFTIKVLLITQLWQTESILSLILNVKCSQ